MQNNQAEYTDWYFINITLLIRSLIIMLSVLSLNIISDPYEVCDLTTKFEVSQ